MKLFLRYLIYSIIIWVIGFIMLIMIPKFLWIPLLIILVIISNIIANDIENATKSEWKI